MPGQVIIASFSPSDKVPGAYGEVQYGTSGQTAAGLPLLLLLVGLKTATGSITPDTQIQQIYQQSDADTYAGAGSELACMAYDALKVAPNVPMFIASPTPAGGAVAATATISIGGAWTTSGPIVVRIAGYTISQQVGATDTANNVATNLAATINGFLSGRLPVTATASTSNVILNCATAGVRGNQHIVFLDPTNKPSGLTVTITGNPWVTATVYPLNSYVVPTVANGFYYKATAISGTGTSGASQPVWPTTVGVTVVDNSGANQITWTCWGQIVATGATTAVQLGGGSGLETYTNLLATLISAGYDRQAWAANDATSVAAIKSQIDTQATLPIGFLQHMGVALNTTSAAAQSIGQTTMNDQRGQCIFYQNSETHPSRIAAAMMALRALTEVSDPDASYDGVVLSTVAPQSQKTDWPVHSLLVTLLNNSDTPLQTINGQAQVCRSITTKSLTGGASDYSTLDTGMAVVPDFVLTQLKLTWPAFQTVNPRVRGDLQPGERQPPSGVAYPLLWTSYVQGQLMDMQAGILPGTCPPILYNVVQFPPTTSYDPNAKRLMCAVPCWPMPNNHQVGISVRQAS